MGRGDGGRSADETRFNPAATWLVYVRTLYWSVSVSYQRLSLATLPEPRPAEGSALQAGQSAMSIPAEVMGVNGEMHALSRRLWGLEILRRLELQTQNALLERGLSS
jgi:hypothetical protein